MICTRADSASDLGSSDFRGRSRNSLSEFSVLLVCHERIPRAPNFHWFVRLLSLERFGRASKGKAARKASSKRFSERNSESANFHWFVRFCRSRNFGKKDKFRERRSACQGETRPSRLNFLFALVLKFLERQNFHSFVGPLSAALLSFSPARFAWKDPINRFTDCFHTYFSCHPSDLTF